MSYNDINAKETYQRMKPSAFIISELDVILARLESADHALDKLPIPVPVKYSSSIRDIRFQLANLRGEILAEQKEHEERIQDLFGISDDDTIPF